MKTKIITLTLLGLMFVNCTNSEKKADQVFPNNDTKTNQQSNSVDNDSTSYYNSKLESLNAEKLNKTQLINQATKLRDSLQGSLNQLEIAIKAINDKKLNPGIEGVNSKLDQLKGQRENLQEQISLQKKEVTLAMKKVEILNDEKKVYEEQKKALYDKGAPPSAFKKVDSLLNGINSKMVIQNDIVKNINRSVADAEEQMIIITGQRDGLSKKIRSNYDTQLIISEFNTDEKARLEAQLTKVNENLETLLDESSNLDIDYKLIASKLSNIESVQSTSNSDNEIESNEIVTTTKSNNTTLALIAVLGLGMLLLVFFLVGKARKKRLNENKK